MSASPTPVRSVRPGAGALGEALGSFTDPLGQAASTEAQARYQEAITKFQSANQDVSTCTSSSRPCLLRTRRPHPLGAGGRGAGDFAAALKVYRTFVTRFQTDPLVVDARQKIKDLKQQLAQRQAQQRQEATPGSRVRLGRVRAQAASAALAAVTVVVLAAGCGGAKHRWHLFGRRHGQRRGALQAAVRRLSHARRGRNRGRDRTEPRRRVRCGPRTGLRESSIQQVVAGQIKYPPEERSTRRASTSRPRAKPAMPPDLVTGDDVDSVAAYVASVAGVPGAAPPPPQGGGQAADGKSIFTRTAPAVTRSPMQARRARSGRISTRRSRRRTSTA